MWFLMVASLTGCMHNTTRYGTARLVLPDDIHAVSGMVVERSGQWRTGESARIGPFTVDDVELAPVLVVSNNLKNEAAGRTYRFRVVTQVGQVEANCDARESRRIMQVGDVRIQDTEHYALTCEFQPPDGPSWKLSAEGDDRAALTGTVTRGSDVFNVATMLQDQPTGQALGYHIAAPMQTLAVVETGRPEVMWMSPTASYPNIVTATSTALLMLPDFAGI